MRQIDSEFLWKQYVLKTNRKREWQVFHCLLSSYFSLFSSSSALFATVSGDPGSVHIHIFNLADHLEIFSLWYSTHNSLRTFKLLWVLCRQSSVMKNKKTQVTEWEDLGLRSYSSMYWVTLAKMISLLVYLILITCVQKKTRQPKWKFLLYQSNTQMLFSLHVLLCVCCYFSLLRNTMNPMKL